jgi:hypothetical protein
MAIKPGSSPVSIVNTTTSPIFNGTIYVGQLTRHDFSEPFERDEWKGQREREVKNPDGSLPIITTISGGRLFQFLSSCNPNDRARYLGTDTSRLDDIYLRKDIREWEFVGDPSTSSITDSLATLYRSHCALKATFNDHLTKAKSGDIDYDTLIAMRSENFSYLTSTHLSMAGSALGSETGVTNCFIDDFERDVAVESPAFGILLYEFRLKVQVITLTPASSSAF